MVPLAPGKARLPASWPIGSVTISSTPGPCIAPSLSRPCAALDLEDQSALSKLLEKLHLEMPGGKVVLDGEDVTGLIRSAEVTVASGAIASSPAVRQRLGEWQRLFAKGRSIVCEGRDQGTIVFPNAGCKFFLSADPTERALRRHRELLARGETIAYEDILAAQRARDQRDRERAIAPMVPAADAVLLDSTGLTVGQVVEQMEAIVRARATEQ